MNLIKACCIDWRELNIELKEKIELEIDIIVKEKGLPRSIFATRLNLLNNWHECCPACGGGINQTVVEPPREITPVTPAPQVAVPVEKTKTNPDIPCPSCTNGNKGQDAKGIEMKCPICHGKGFFPGSQYHIVENESGQKVIQRIKISAEKLAAIDVKRREVIEAQEAEVKAKIEAAKEKKS